VLYILHICGTVWLQRRRFNVMSLLYNIIMDNNNNSSGEDSGNKKRKSDDISDNQNNSDRITTAATHLFTHCKRERVEREGG